MDSVDFIEGYNEYVTEIIERNGWKLLSPTTDVAPS